jgi:hypothetical protein
MNERIKELKKQAWEYTMAVHDGHIVPPLDKEVWPVDKVFDEKFAELIVKECLKEIKDMIVDESELLYPNNKQTTEFVNDRLLDAYDNIKEHFGVAE